ncbi:MAG: FtsX-like permease family protein [candidate division Zixibacteria bacterium]|nr:FtsX-like permease family protein [candidate division Zixibacteria bacterium]
MFKNYLKVAFRNLTKHKLYTAINIFGLAMGLATSIIVIGHIFYEFSFEDMHENKNRISCVWGNYTETDSVNQYVSRVARVMPPLGPAIIENIPDIEKAAIFRHYPDVLVKIDGIEYRAGNMICANPDFLEVFTLPLLQGNTENILDDPFGVLITEEAGHKYFGEQNPIGQTVTINDNFKCQISGILQNIPRNTRLHCDFISSYSILSILDEDLDSWQRFPTDHMFLLLTANADPDAVKQKIQSIVDDNLGPDSQIHYQVGLMPFDDYYFGATRSHFIKQFIGESMVLVSLSMLFGLALFELARHDLDRLFQRPSTIGLFDNPMMIISVIVLGLVVSVLSGFYPSLYISRLKPVDVLQSKTAIKSSKSILRKVLVSFQFTIAILFVFCTIITFRQIQFVKDADMGFDQNNVLVLNFDGDNAPEECRIMKKAILAKNKIVSVTASDCPPGRSNEYYYQLYTDPEKTKEIIVRAYNTDQDFISTFGLEITRGEGFSDGITGDFKQPIIITESAVEHLEIDQPIGYRFYRKADKFYEVIGVVKDFHGSTSTWQSEPVTIITLRPDRWKTLSLKLPPDNISGSIASIKQTWDSTLPGQLFTYSFIDDEIDGNYDDDRWIGIIFGILAVITITLACLGIFGLVSFTAVQKTKEIGIRKVLGASTANLISLLAKE